MAHIVLFCISTLFVLLIGSPSCSAKNDCTHKNIIKCRADNINSSNRCRFNKRIVACLEKIDGCTDDDIAESRQSDLDYFRSEICKGLDDGDCPDAYVERCAKDIPQNIRRRQNMSDPVIQHSCQTLKSKATEAKNCMRKLSKKCDRYSASQVMNQNIQDVETKEEYCGFR